MQVPIKYIVTICQWRIEDKFEVKILKENFTVRLVIRPLDVKQPCWSYYRDLEELGLTHSEVKKELFYLADILSANNALVEHIYDFCVRTKGSLGMAFIAWNMTQAEQEKYEQLLGTVYELIAEESII